MSRFNPFIFGQLALLLGTLAVGLAIIPPHILKQESTPTSPAVGENDRQIQERIHKFHIGSLTIAAIGFCLGVIGWIRERPPVLSVMGIVLCSIALLWYPIMFVVGVVIVICVLFILFTH